MDNELIASIFEGTFGSAVGLLSTFFVLRATLRADRQKANEDIERERDREKRTRAREGVIDIADKCHSIKMSGPTEDSVRDLQHSLVIFSARIGEDFPHAALWSEFQGRQVEDCFQPGEDPRAIMWQSGYIYSGITKWLHTGFEDTNLPIPDKSKIKGDRRDGIGGGDLGKNDRLLKDVTLRLKKYGLYPTLENVEKIIAEIKETDPANKDD